MAGLAGLLVCFLAAGCAGMHTGGWFGRQPAAENEPPPVPEAASEVVPQVTVPVAAGSEAAPNPVQEAEALIDGGQTDAALTLLKRTLEDGTAPTEDALYWIAVLSFAPPISDRAQGEAALERLTSEFPDGERRHAAAALKALADERDQLEADNASLKEDLQKLLNIDVEAQRQRRATP